MSQLAQVQELLKTLRLSETSTSVTRLIKEAESNEVSYTSFLLTLLTFEQKRREEKQTEKRLKWATFPYHKTMNEFNLDEQRSLSKKQFNQ